MNYYYYLDQGQGILIRIKSKRKPSKRAKPYVVQELSNYSWKMPVFPEITSGQLKKLTYLGKVKTI